MNKYKKEKFWILTLNFLMLFPFFLAFYFMADLDIGEELKKAFMFLMTSQIFIFLWIVEIKCDMAIKELKKKYKEGESDG